MQAQRHQLYCSIADVLQHTRQSSCSNDVLARLQTVLEAEACLSCIDDTESELQDAVAGVNMVHPAAKKALPASSAGAAASALQQLKEELTQRVQESIQQDQHQQHKPRQGKVGVLFPCPAAAVVRTFVDVQVLCLQTLMSVDASLYVSAVACSS